MKNLTAILVFTLCAFAALHTLNAQVQTFLPNDAKSLRQLEGARLMNDFPFSKEDNKKAIDRDDPVFKLRATRSDDWDNGWTGYDSLVNIYDNLGNITQSTSRNFDGAVWNKSRRQLNQYNLDNKRTEAIWQNWDGLVWINDFRITDEFDLDNNLIQTTAYYWDGATWANPFRDLFQYDGENHLTLRTRQDWDNGGWKTTSRTLYEYNSEGQNTLYLNQVIDGGSWANDFRISYQYTGANLTLELIQDWANSSWVNSRRWIREYDQNDNHTTTLTQQWDGSSWTNWYYFSFQYNTNNDRSSYTSYYWENSNWIADAQFLYEYDENYNLTQYIVQGWNGTSFVSTNRTIYYYDSFVSTNESVSVSEALELQAFPNPSNGTFFLNAQELDQQACQVFLYDQLGRLCLQQACSGLASEQIDANNLSNGAYILRVIAQDGKQAAKHIQISK